MASIRPHYRIPAAVEHLYDVTVFDKTILTTVTKHPDAVAEWINDVKPLDHIPGRLIGFDVGIFAGRDNIPCNIGTLHLYVANRCLVIQLRHLTAACPALNEFLTDENNVFLGIDIYSKMNLVMDQFEVEGAVTFVDVGDLAAERCRRAELRDAEQSVLLRTCLGTGVEKGDVPTDWGRSYGLSDSQVQCACIDAFVSFVLAKWLRWDED